MTNQYENIRTKLNTMFPERLELKFGCEVNRGEDEIVFIGEYEEYRGNIRRVYCSDDTAPLNEIFGQPVTLQDILKGLDQKFKLTSHIYSISSQGVVTLIDMNKKSWREKDTDIELDLSKDPKDWGEEELSAINELL